MVFGVGFGFLFGYVGFGCVVGISACDAIRLQSCMSVQPSSFPPCFRQCCPLRPVTGTKQDHKSQANMIQRRWTNSHIPILTAPVILQQQHPDRMCDKTMGNNLISLSFYATPPPPSPPSPPLPIPRGPCSAQTNGRAAGGRAGIYAALRARRRARWARQMRRGRAAGAGRAGFV